MSLFSQIETSHGFAGFLQENCDIALPLLLGFAGVYLLLPRVKRITPLLGGSLAGAALVLAGYWWTKYEAVWVEQLLFYIFAGLAVLGAGLMLSQKNPVHAALAFALVVLSSCGLFLLLAAPFLMAATIIIYAGAIVVTFLFVIMLAQQAGISSADVRSREPFLAAVAGFVMLGTLVVVIERGYSTASIDTVLGKLEALKDAKAAEEVNAIVQSSPPEDKDPNKVVSLVFVEEIVKTIPAIGRSEKVVGAAKQIELEWSRGKVEKVNEAAAIVLEFGRAARITSGSLPAEKGSPAVLARKPLPAQNVAAIGRIMFTEYLIPVEMAGVLLLVATIGAIVIASRRTEGL